MFLVPSFGFLIAAPAAGAYGIQFGRRLIAGWSITVIAFSLPAVAVGDQYRSQPAESLPGMFGVGLGLGATEATLNPMVAAIVDSRYPGAYGAGFGLADMAFSSGFLIGPIAGTALYQLLDHQIEQLDCQSAQQPAESASAKMAACWLGSYCAALCVFGLVIFACVPLLRAVRDQDQVVSGEEDADETWEHSETITTA